LFLSPILPTVSKCLKDSPGFQILKPLPDHRFILRHNTAVINQRGYYESKNKRQASAKEEKLQLLVPFHNGRVIGIHIDIGTGEKPDVRYAQDGQSADEGEERFPEKPQAFEISGNRAYLINAQTPTEGKEQVRHGIMIH
jgi:hypothetical protein